MDEAPKEKPRRGRGWRIAADFVLHFQKVTASDGGLDLAKIIGDFGVSSKRLLPIVRTYEREFYSSHIAPRIARATKYPGGGRAIATDAMAMAKISITATGSASIREISRRIGISAWRAIVALRTWEPGFYEDHIRGRYGRKMTFSDVPDSAAKKKRLDPAEVKQRPLTAKQKQAARVFKKRVEGASCREAVKGTEITWSNAQSHVRAWGAKTGTDVSPAFSRHTRRDEGNG